MTLKKQVLEDIQKRLNEDLKKVHTEINQNKYIINSTAKRQAVLKREVKELYSLIRTTRTKKETST